MQFKPFWTQLENVHLQGLCSLKGSVAQGLTVLLFQAINIQICILSCPLLFYDCIRILTDTLLRVTWRRYSICVLEVAKVMVNILHDKIECPSGMNLYVKDAVVVAVEAVTCFLKSGHNKREIFPSMAMMEIRLTISKDNKCTQTRQPRSRR